jgi:hypothetical protein
VNKVTTEDKERLAEAMSRLSDASFCFGAVSHPEYTDPRKGVLLARAQVRLQDAAAEYHEIAMAISFLNSTSKDHSVRS